MIPATGAVRVVCQAKNVLFPISAQVTADVRTCHRTVSQRYVQRVIYGKVTETHTMQGSRPWQ